MKIEIKKIELNKLSEWSDNPRKIAKKDLDILVKSLQENPEFLAARPLLVKSDGDKFLVFGGNQRLKALKKIGLTQANCAIFREISDDKMRELAIRDNVQNGEWDDEKLANWDADDLREWGLDLPTFHEIRETPAVDIDENETFSELGKFYKLGRHRLFCGSFADKKLEEIFAKEKAAAVFTDPPYNVNIVGKAGKIQNDNFAKHDEFAKFISEAVAAMKKYSIDGAAIISWMSDTELLTLYEAFRENGLNVKTIIAWVKNSFTLGRGDFQNQKEMAIYGLNEGSFDSEAGEDADSDFAIYARAAGGKFTKNRNVSNTWFFAKPTRNKYHPTMKPIGLCAKGILAISNENDIIFDPFLGSGSTLLAAEQTSRTCYGSELDPKYCDAIRKRWQILQTGSDDGWKEATK